ncbi:hypothetical protein [Paraburkholderia lycopersici]|uniref:Uncharacterized protein n=1 Tax=Paraburkholderia lycopersici TaxID=416944 RepID=A0A1G6X502_9BURK|nr:hypothetical protein [Paraburkholderia lycopersici]SDD72447.1 hypothetical protein SAMN05421548_12456 [Paraburkholderia lycopersici]
MIKNVGTAENIRMEILRRVQGSADLGDSCRDCDIPVPRKVDPAGNGGCNWVIDELRVAQECVSPLKAVIAEMMREYDLA